MSGFLLRVRLILSLSLFIWQLLYSVLIWPYRSLLLVVCFTIWFSVSFFIQTRTNAPQAGPVQQSTKLLSLLLTDFSAAGFQSSERSTREVQSHLQQWLKLREEIPATRDFLLNGALLYFSLGDVEKAQQLVHEAQLTDPNNPLFKAPLTQLFN